MHPRTSSPDAQLRRCALVSIYGPSWTHHYAQLVSIYGPSWTPHHKNVESNAPSPPVSLHIFRPTTPRKCHSPPVPAEAAAAAHARKPTSVACHHMPPRLAPAKCRFTLTYLYVMRKAGGPLGPYSASAAQVRAATYIACARFVSFCTLSVHSECGLSWHHYSKGAVGTRGYMCMRCLKEVHREKCSLLCPATLLMQVCVFCTDALSEPNGAKWFS